LARLGVVRGQRYPEEEVMRRLRQAGVMNATEQLAAKIGLEQMGMIEGRISDLPNRAAALWLVRGERDVASSVWPHRLRGLPRRIQPLDGALAYRQRAKRGGTRAARADPAPTGASPEYPAGK
jgi:hypothetical protein